MEARLPEVGGDQQHALVRLRQRDREVGRGRGLPLSGHGADDREDLAVALAVHRHDTGPKRAVGLGCRAARLLLGHEHHGSALLQARHPWDRREDRSVDRRLEIRSSGDPLVDPIAHERQDHADEGAEEETQGNIENVLRARRRHGDLRREDHLAGIRDRRDARELAREHGDLAVQGVLFLLRLFEVGRPDWKRAELLIERVALSLEHVDLVLDPLAGRQVRRVRSLSLVGQIGVRRARSLPPPPSGGRGWCRRCRARACPWWSGPWCSGAGWEG